MWLFIITLKILWKLAVFSYSDVDIDIDGSLKVTPMSGWLLSLHIVSKLDNACKFRSYQTGLCIPWCLEHLCIWLQFVVSPFKLCLICIRSWLSFAFSKDRNPSDLFQISAKESKCTLILFVYWAPECWILVKDPLTTPGLFIRTWISLGSILMGTWIWRKVY